MGVRFSGQRGAAAIRSVPGWLLVVLVSLLLPLRLAAQFPAELEGSVSDASSGAPVPSATVQAGGAAAVETRGRGEFSIRGLEPGVLTLLVTALGYHPQRLTLTLSNGEHRTVSVRLVPAPIELPTVVANARTDRPGVTVLDRSAIAASGSADLGGLLAGQPGLLVERRGGPAGAATVSIRGGAANQALVLLDGVPLNDALTGSADISLVSLPALDSVVIQRGGASDRYGSRAMAGVVALYSRRAGSADGAQLGGRAGAWGERGGDGSISGATGGETARWSGHLSGGVRHVDGDFPFDVPAVRGGGTDVRANAASDQRNAQAGLGYASRGIELRVRGDWLSVDRGMPGTIVQQSLTAEQAQRRVGGGGNLRLSRGSLNWVTDFAVQHQRATFVDTAPQFSAPYHDSLTALTLTGQSGIDVAVGPVSVSAGLDLRYLRPRGTTLNDSTPASQTFGGLYLSGVLRRSWGTSGFVQLSAAARGDAGSGVGDPVLSPRLSVAAGKAGWSLAASWSESFSPPTLGDLFFQEGVQVRANPDLRPERVRNEINLTATVPQHQVLGTEVSASLSAYRADIDDMILWTPNFAFVWSPGNFDIARQGIEGEVTDRIPVLHASLGVNAAYSDLRYRGPVYQGQVIYRPHWTGAAHLEVGLLGFRLGGKARYVGVRRTGIGSGLNLLPAFVVADAQLARRFRIGRGTLELTAGIDNLFDQRTTLLIDYPSPGRGWWVGTRIALGQDRQGTELN